jgi:hypothetical protein
VSHHPRPVTGANALFYKVLAGIVALLAAGARAHVPYLEERDYTPEAPYAVRDVENSKAIYARIGQPGDVDVYRMDLAQPTRIFVKTEVPWCPEYETFGVTFALAGPGLPVPSIALPVALPAGWGAVVVRYAAGAPRRTWTEPFSGMKLWRGGEYTLDAAPAGRYEMIVWNEAGRTGDYIAVIGKAENFGGEAMRQVGATMPKLERGAHLMVPCDPTAP